MAVRERSVLRIREVLPWNRGGVRCCAVNDAPWPVRPSSGPSSDEFWGYQVRSARRAVKIGAVLRRRNRRVPPDASPLGAPPRIGAAVARFVLGSLVAVAVVAVVGYVELRRGTLDDARPKTQRAGDPDRRHAPPAPRGGPPKRHPPRNAEGGR